MRDGRAEAHETARQASPALFSGPGRHMLAGMGRRAPLSSDELEFLVTLVLLKLDARDRAMDGTSFIEELREAIIETPRPVPREPVVAMLDRLLGLRDEALRGRRAQAVAGSA